VTVESEDQPERLLLETKIIRDDGFQKQQGSSFGTVRLFTAVSDSSQIPSLYGPRTTSTWPSASKNQRAAP
jgi:hypothetical protein